MSNNEIVIYLVRRGLGINSSEQLDPVIDWNEIYNIAEQQGLLAIALDGVNQLSVILRPPKQILLQWIGRVMQHETQFALQQKTATKLALVFHDNDIRTYVLKGAIISECYPCPSHRVSVDMDCFLVPEKGEFDAWAKGNELVRSYNYEVKEDFYKNSTFVLPGLTVENHHFFTAFRGDKKLTSIERMLQSLLLKDKGEDKFEGAWLYRPPVMVSAFFIIQHACSHFLHEGLTWRHVLDWMLFYRKHQDDIDWEVFDGFINDFGYRSFFNSFNRLGLYLLGEISDNELNGHDKRMLEDIWTPIDVHDVSGIKGKFALAGNTWRARWKYHLYYDISMFHALWIQVKGFLFIKHPKLD